MMTLVQRSMAAAIAVTSIMTLPRVVEACSCLPPPPPREAADEADVVFEGTVEPAKTVAGKHHYPVRVERVYKGQVPDQVTVATASDSARCGRRFEAGRAYLIYASQLDDTTFADTLCSRTSLRDDAEEDRAALGEGHAPSSEGAEAPPDPPAPEPSPTPTQEKSKEPAAEALEPKPSSPKSHRGCSVGGVPSSTPLLWVVLASAVRRRRRRAIGSSSGGPI